MNKKDLLDFMHCCGFDWICDVSVINGHEYVASKCHNQVDLWWRPLEVEGSGFTRLFKGCVRKVKDE
jgi:hypothetical protein